MNTTYNILLPNRSKTMAAFNIIVKLWNHRKDCAQGELFITNKSFHYSPIAFRKAYKKTLTGKKVWIYFTIDNIDGKVCGAWIVQNDNYMLNANPIALGEFDDIFKTKRMKFGEMPAGTHFTDGRRKFVKLQPTTGVGLPQTHERVVGTARLGFNSVDYNGGAANCPDWLEFEVLPQE